MARRLRASFLRFNRRAEGYAQAIGRISAPPPYRQPGSLGLAEPQHRFDRYLQLIQKQREPDRGHCNRSY